MNDFHKQIFEWLRFMVARDASDLFITAGFPAAIKLDGKVTPITKQSLTPSETLEFAKAVMTEKQRAEFQATKEANFAIHDPEIGRFRVNAFVQQGRTGLVFRLINTVIPKLESLHLPPSLRDISMMPRGLVLLAGSTGSGKSTTLAAMIGYRNGIASEHIITVEDPIEFVHQHGKCIITQREVGSDTESWEVALKNTLRQAPDVIMIGEIRDRETMEYAMSYAETGHLCLSTVHANNGSQTLDRILSFFPRDRRDQLLLDLSLNLRSIVSQRLVPRTDGKGRIPAAEVMLNSPLISDLIMKGRLDEIRDIMARSRDLGMQTFDQSLYDLNNIGIISAEDALRNADSFNDLRLKIKLHAKEERGESPLSGLEHLDIV
ncbi:MAG: type IV pili twitching motility protein PilT [Hydrogenophilales bacterium CG17_big_fil_post_rev_8_21_14_2_50_63_12]|nr:MAG: type IV pili twitching motility protein PilT [Hydrogenophilales bacterium CG17_big_fil_post_rev_8_21_14_2_50_63_12]PJB01985.1 MAG: type IV pili twitching motility protein PilT [Hydrogenophilales bacterium CG_4_9_14_3_um_filter_63_34]